MYIQRTIEKIIKKLENDYPVITVIGPRQSGKTSLVRHLYPDYAYVNLEEAKSYQLAKESVDEFFKMYKPPVIIDEIQRVPDLLSKIQVLTDESGQKAKQFIVTGSQEIHIKGHIAQSLAGRAAIFQVLPLSLEEMARAGNVETDRDTLLLQGCYPKLFSTDISSWHHYYQNYISTYIQKDVKQITSIQDEGLFYTFLKLLAGRVGNLLNVSALSNDLGVARATVDRWLSILQASYIIYLLQPWHSNRDGTLVKTSKIYFCDTGIVSSLLDIITPDQMLRDPLRGSIFENYCVIEAVKQRNNEALPHHLYFFRNKYGLEIDLIFEKNRQLIPYEIKSSDRYDKDQLRNLVQFGKEQGKNLSHSDAGGLIHAGTIRTTLDGYSIYPLKDIQGLFA
ncbi:MAG: ATP-binding protein [Sphaerochaeta sp.]|nr:ATP-binding protein [Sphaerochaeta sp.]